MKLRDRFIVTLCAIALILAAPTLYGLLALNELRGVAENLRSRDAVGALVLGRLQTAFADVEAAERVYLALANAPAGERAPARLRVDSAMARVEAGIERLGGGDYRPEVEPAAEAWEGVRVALAEERRLVEGGEVAAADLHRSQAVVPALRRMDATLEPIAIAMDEAGRAEVEHAQSIAARAATTTLIALAVALAIALALGSWLARGILPPLNALRRAMSVVASGDLAPEVAISPDRPDEMGDLARSFRWMTRQLAELERLRAQFVAVASHELKTPLSVIKGYVSLVKEGIYGEVTPDQEKVLASVSDQSDRLGRLIQQLLDVSRFEAGGGRLEVQAIDLRAFLHELTVSFEALALQNEIRFLCDVDASVPESIDADPDRLNEVVGNLLSNAFKFTPRHGQISLRARRGARHDDDRVIIEVSDTGVGIPAEQLPRIFEKFYQVENEAQPLSMGSGLGLAIAKEIVEAHGGTIAADSRVGKGTTFRVFLPLAHRHGDGAQPTRPQ